MIPKDAFIQPDDPMVYDPFRDALISPDEPFEPRDEESGVVVGMNGSTDREMSRSNGVSNRLATGVMLGLEQVAAALEAVSAELKENGIKGLTIAPGLSTFEKSLKNHVVEYLSSYS